MKESSGSSSKGPRRPKGQVRKNNSDQPNRENELRRAIISDKKLFELNLKPRKAILSPWLLEKSINMISGSRGIGKTWLGISIVDAVTRGIYFGPWRAVNPVPSLYLDGEMLIQEIRERLRILNPDREERKCPLRIYSDEWANSKGIRSANLSDPDWRDKMTEILKKLNIGLFVIDNIASLSGGIEENSKKDWDPINQWLIRLKFNGCSTILIHHTGKSGHQRGTSAREDNIDTSLVLKRPRNGASVYEARFIISFTKVRVSVENTLDIQDQEFKLCKSDEGYFWENESGRNDLKEAIIGMLEADYRNKDICEELDVTPGYVSQIKQQLDSHETLKERLQRKKRSKSRPRTISRDKKFGPENEADEPDEPDLDEEGMDEEDASDDDEEIDFDD